MICKNCETENPEEAVYCKNCGKRLDGKLVCPSCGEENPEDAKVCTQCGTQIVQSAPAKEKTAGGWKKWVELAGGISAMVAVFCVLLCTFLVGVSASYGSRAYQMHDIWYYFGDIWKSVKALKFEGMAKAAIYIQAVYGLLISIGMIVSTLVFSILAAVRFGMKASGKSNKDYLKHAIGAVMSFICGTAILVSFDAMSGDGASIVPNAAGIAGIVCGLIFLCGCLGCRVALKDQILDKKSAMKISFTVCTLVLLAITVAFAVKPLCIPSEDSSLQDMFASQFGLFTFAGFLGGYSTAAEGLALPFAFTILAVTVQIAVVILAMAAIGSRLKNLVADEPKSGISSAVWITVISALLLIFSIVALASSIDKLDGWVEGFNYAYIIVEFVFAVAVLVETIVCKAVCKDKKKVA